MTTPFRLVDKAAQHWENRGKTVRGLIKELQSFENDELMVEISLDGGVTGKPISLVGKQDGKCLLMNISNE
jgi:hypothetical protein